MGSIEIMVKVLTADLGRCPEGGGNVGVELNIEVVVTSQLLIASIDLFLDPIREGSTHYCVDNIHHPLPRQLSYIFFVRKIRPDFLIKTSLLMNAL